MFEQTLAIICGLASLSIFNAYRSQVSVTSDPKDAKIREQGEYLWDLANDHPGTVNWSDYLSSLKFDRPLSLRGLLVAIVVAKFHKNLLLRTCSMVIIGAIPFLGSIIIARQPIELLGRIEQFLSMFSIGIFSSFADLVHYLKPFGMKKSEDAVAIFIKHGKCEPSIPYYDPLKAFPRVLEHIPDELSIPKPQPLLPNLLPGLCFGAGGLKPLHSERVVARSAMVCEMFNRLSANLYVYADVVDASKLFLVKYGDESIQSVDELVDKLPGIKVLFQRNSSAFGVLFCVKDEKDQYRQLPGHWIGRTAIRDPETGNQLTTLSYHSALVVTGSEECPLGPFRVQFFLGPDGVTSWKVGDETLRPWAPLCHSDPLDAVKARDALRAASCAACAINLASRTQDLAVGGYALHGTCLDTASIIKQVLYGKIDDFPLVASGDSRAGTMAACVYLAKHMLQGEHTSWAKDMLNRVSTAVGDLPDDAAVVPGELLNAIDRFQTSLHGDFVSAQKLKKNLQSIRKKWERILVKTD